MAILKTDKINKQGTLIGTYVSDRTFRYLSLYCVAKNTLKSRILTGLFLEWIGKQKWYYNEHKLMQMIIENIQAQRKKKKYAEMKLDDFLVEIENELIKKGLPIDIVSKILTEIQ
jgi:hypothetical protein